MTVLKDFLRITHTVMAGFMPTIHALRPRDGESIGFIPPHTLAPHLRHRYLCRFDAEGMP
jgi:hypothetical protein